MGSVRKTYPLIDVLKFVFAIGVVALHAHPLRDSSPFGDYMITQCFTRIGVPFFFVCAGYFLFSKMRMMELDYVRIRKYVLRILRMLLVWTLIYLPVIIYQIMQNPHGVVYGGATKVYRLLTNGNAEFHLWFLHALVIGIVLITGFLKSGWKFPKILALAGSLHIIALLGGAYYFVYLALFPSGSEVYEMLYGMTKYLETTNGFTVGFLYVSLGAYLGMRQPRLTKGMLWGGFLLSWGLFIAEAAWIKIVFPFIKGSTPYIFLIPATIFTFLLGLNIKIKNKPVYMVMRKMSMFIYFVHPWFLFLVSGITKRIYPIDSLTNFIVVTCLTLLIARMMVVLSSRNKKGLLAVLG